ncbi:helix-turn-helix domain-containing protein [Pedobacter panaciterrae]|uniref:helix-turn-helix domain-containing protein n=1 Tax=Pedobacter panaciterrae TaxID=363849 RepID=UPI002596B16B|nr:helix-turn-helix domain-containing protein [uncultured Pedobacter sp.]
MENITFEKLPAIIGQLYTKIEHIENMLANQPTSAPKQSKYVDMKGAAEITSKSPNALRVQISLGKLKSIKKGSRHYFEREYLEKWLSGNLQGAELTESE